ncbi:MAG TPA: hypothetical protein VFK06_09025 [Candidatus Angelobacter sp.]|nr:hypothetical protein [Candidatus Angelobacter sp.]
MERSEKNRIYLSGLGSSLGFSYLPEWNFGTRLFRLPKWVIGDFATKPGGIFGMHAGYLTAMGVFMNSDGPDYLQIIVRHTPIAAPALRQLKNAIKAIPGFRDFIRYKRVATTKDFVKIEWGLPDLWERPGAEEVANMLDLILQEISCHARALDGKCEDCRAVAAPQIVFVDGIPGHHCAGCVKAATAAYDAIKADYPRTTFLGAGIALAMSIVWGLIQPISGGSGNGEIMLQICFLGFMVTGVAIFWGVFRSLGKKELQGFVLASALTLSSRLMAYSLSGSFLVHGRPVANGWFILGGVNFLVALFVLPILCRVSWCKSRPAILQPATVGGPNSPALPEKTGKLLSV